jgi:tripartite-type tricarboxylate transporter receptor subunit TctC
VKDFDHLGRITDVPMTLVSKMPFPANNVTELLAWMKSEAARGSYGHAGIGSASHLCALVLMKELGVQMNGIAYRGTGPAMNDLLSGQFDIMCDQTTNTTNHINAGKIKGYAVTTKFKVPSVPQLPTLDSGAIPGFDVSAWHAMWAPKGLSKDVSDKFVAVLQTALKDPKVIERFASLGTEPVAQNLATPDALKSQLVAEVKRWDAVIKATGIKGN